MTDEPKKLLVSAVRYQNPVGKSYALDADDKLIKLAPCKRTDFAKAVVREFETPAQYFEWVATLDSHTMRTSGTFPIEADGQEVRQSWAAGHEYTATKDHLVFEPKRPGVVCVDLDIKSADEVAALYPEAPKRIVGHDAFRAALIEACPALKDVAMRISDSASSHIQVDGVEVTGENGLHGEFIIDDASRTPIVLTALHNAFWALGYGWAFVAKDGKIHERSPVDMVMDRPTQPFFGVPHFTDSRITSGGKATVYEGGIASAAAIPYICQEVQKKSGQGVDGLVLRAREALQPKSDEVREAHAKELAPSYAKRAGCSIKQAETEILEGFKTALPWHFPITTKRGEELIAGDLWDTKYKGLDILYPLEPEYQAGSKVFFDKHNRPYIHSFAHGAHRLIIQEPKWVPPVAVKDGYDAIMRGIAKATGSSFPQNYIDGRRVADLMMHIVRDRKTTRTLLHMHKMADGGEYVLNTYGADEFFKDIADLHQYIRGDAIRDGARGENWMRWVGEARVTGPEARRLKMLETTYAAVFGALADGLNRFWATERQTDLLNFEVDMFATNGSVEYRRVGSQTETTLIQPHKPFKTDRWDYIPQNELDEVVADYNKHFGKLDELLRFFCAARFASDGREAFLWMRAVSDFGKSLLGEGIFGSDGLRIIMSVSLSQIEKAIEGAPSPMQPEEFAGAWIMFTDEFKAASSSLKHLNNKIRVAPKNRMQADVKLYAKFFCSAEDVPSLTQSGVDEQIANRFSHWDIRTGPLTSRPLFIKNKARYLDALRLYSARFLNKLVAQYQELGRLEAEKVANHKLKAFHDKYRITNETGALDDVLEERAEDFTLYMKKLAGKKLSGLEDLTLPREARACMEDLHCGFIGVSDPTRVVILSNYAKHVEVWLKATTGSSEIVKFANRKSEFIAMLGDKHPGLVGDKRPAPWNFYEALELPSGEWKVQTDKRRNVRGLRIEIDAYEQEPKLPLNKPEKPFTAHGFPDEDVDRLRESLRRV